MASLGELAKVNGISLATACRYRKAGIDLEDRRAVEEHKHDRRTRRGVGNYRRRFDANEVQQAVTISRKLLEQKAADLEEIICSIYWLAVESQLGAPLVAEILERTAPVVERMGTEE
jgi:hypothetical protein